MFYRLPLDKVRNAFLLSGSLFIDFSYSLLVSIVWARYTSKELFGQYQLVFSYLTIAITLAFTGLNKASEISAANNKLGNLSFLIRKKFKYSLYFSSIFLIFYLYFLLRHFDQRFCNAILVTACLMPVYSLSTLTESWYSGLKNFKQLALYNLVSKLVLLTSLFLGIYASDDLSVIMVFSIAPASLLGVGVLFYLRKKYKNQETDVKLIDYGKKLTGVYVVNSLLNLDKTIIEYSLSFQAVATYGIAQTFSKKSKLFMVLIQKLFVFDFATKNSVSEVWRDYRKFHWLINGLCVLLAAIGYLYIDTLIDLLFGDNFSDSKTFAKFFWVVTIMGIPQSILSSIFVYQRHTSIVYTREIINVTVKFLLYLILIPLFGIWGVLYSMIISASVNFLYTYWNLKIVSGRERL